jgi:hypothetical protein
MICVICAYALLVMFLGKHIKENLEKKGNYFNDDLATLKISLFVLLILKSVQFLFFVRLYFVKISLNRATICVNFDLLKPQSFKNIFQKQNLKVSFH